jgi:hypothetical protein
MFAENRPQPTELQIVLYRWRLLNLLREEAQEIHKAVAAIEPEEESDLREVLSRLDK